MGNSWIELPIISAIEYFSRTVIWAYHWAIRYAYLFGVCGLVWSGFKVIMSRMTVKDLWWDTFFKWTGFLILISIYPAMTGAFMDIGNEIGKKAGGGQNEIISALKQLRETINWDLATIDQSASEGMETELESRFEGLELSTDFSKCEGYDDYIQKVTQELETFKFSGKKDLDIAKNMVQQWKDNDEAVKELYGASTLSAINNVLIEKKVDKKDVNGVRYTDTYVDLDIYLRTKEGEYSKIISPSSLLRLCIMCCQIMHQKMNQQFHKVIEDINNRDTADGLKGIPDHMKKGFDTIKANFNRIPQTIMYLFCCIVLIAATVFAGIQYIMTVFEYVIIVGIGAIFIPLMLFDGTKDIPKKLIPVFISFMVKIIVITICLMFVYHLMIMHASNMIVDDGGMNWSTVGEILFESILIFVLTQNAPKIAQTILTGQPQLSMGEALQGVGTALATGIAMKQAPGAAAKLAARGSGKLADGYGAIMKSNAASSAAKASLGEGAGFGKRMLAGAAARGAVASQALKDRVAAKYESARHSSGTGFSVLDKALQTAGLSGSGAGGYGGGSAGGNDSAYGQNGTKTGPTESLSTQSNRFSKNATIYDKNLGKQRAMTLDEWGDEKISQGNDIGESVGKWINSLSEKKVAQGDNSLPDNLTGNERANS